MSKQAWKLDLSLSLSFFFGGGGVCGWVGVDNFGVVA